VDIIVVYQTVTTLVRLIGSALNWVFKFHAFPDVKSAKGKQWMILEDTLLLIRALKFVQLHDFVSGTKKRCLKNKM